MPRPTVVPTMKVARGSHLVNCSRTCRHRGCPKTAPRSRPVGKLALRSDAGIFFTVPVWLLVLVRGRHSCPTIQQGNLMTVHPLPPAYCSQSCALLGAVSIVIWSTLRESNQKSVSITSCCSTPLTLLKADRD